MKRSVIAAVLMLGAAAATAQVYKWTDDKGIVHYSDMPPTSAVKKVEVKSFDGGVSTVDLPFELAEAARNAPVTLYTTGQCNACDQGRSMLTARGIPFAEKTVATNDDIERLKQAGSAGQLPFLLVGSNKLVGFEAGAWTTALNSAAYPATRALPANYKNPVAESAAPARPNPQEVAAQAKAAAAARAAADAEDKRRKLPPPPENAPPGFQF